ncbi:MAG: arylsulfatase [Opitutales bacterium]|nr:arylsulfatase [Opitutales bacterium]
MKKLIILTTSLLILSFSAFSRNQPNIIVVLVDDMGYSDIGCYGGEIETPNIDRLAKDGIRFRQFYNTARCCPTRASMLTGLFQHQMGIGLMTSEGRWDFDFGVDGYSGNLNRNGVTIAEVLKSAGYHTYMTGKWHLGSADIDDRPNQRGFDRYYGCHRGAFSFFKLEGEKHLWLDNNPLPPTDSETYYTTDAFTDKAIEFIVSNEPGEPFFLYLAHNAPHWPLHAKEQDIEKYVGNYSKGWDKIREERLQRQKEIGLFDESVQLTERDKRVRPWAEVDAKQKVHSDYRMAVYAAQVDCVDQNMGKLIEALEKRGELDNTLILFLSDNGASPEPFNEFGGQDMDQINNPDNGGIVSYGLGWANASSTPFHSYKRNAEEGGIRTPLVVHWPKGISKKLRGEWVDATGHIVDFMPTFVELSGAKYPTMHKSHSILPMEGHSLVQVFKEGVKDHEHTMFFEHTNNCGIRSGDWKMVCRFGEWDWKLYDLKNDPVETNDLAKQRPDVVAELAAAWHSWSKRAKVTPKGTKTENSYD